AIFLVTVPSTINRSHCLRPPATACMPNLSGSRRGPIIAPNSALQQAVVICTGQRAYIRLQFTTCLIGPEPIMVLTNSLILPIQTPAKSCSVSWLIFLLRNHYLSVRSKPRIQHHSKSLSSLGSHVAQTTDMHGAF